MTETTTARWRERVREWRSSGQSIAEFAKGRDFAASTLRWWAYKLGAGVQPTKKSQPSRQATSAITLLPVRRRTPKTRSPAATGLVLELRGVQIRVDYGFDRTLLQEVIAALGGG